MTILALLFLIPQLGGGPIWNKFETATAGCKQNWWTNLLWINNLYPVNFDDKCLPWTWFVPCYVQMSMLVPIIVCAYLYIENKCVAGLLFTGLTVIFLGL